VAVYGTAEAVPLTDRAAVKENKQRQKQQQKQIPCGNDKQESRNNSKAKTAGLAFARSEPLPPIRIC
jgi:hypothetical protein